MRLLLINYEYPPLGGGAGNATAHIARELGKTGVDVTVLTSAFRGLPREERLGNVRIVRCRTLRRREDRSNPLEMLAFMISACFRVLGLTRRWRPDACIAFFGIPCGPVALLLKWCRCVPYIVSLRGGDVPGFDPDRLGTYHAVTGWLIRFVWRRAAAVVANSDGLRELAQSAAPDVSVSVIPNGVDTEQFHPPPEPRSADGPVRLLFVGRLVHQKGVDVLLNALATLRPDHDLTLTIAGDGPDRSTLAQQASELGLTDRVEFLGWVARPDLPDLYRSADVFVLPSRDEGMANSLLEAMATGLPVIVTSVPGCAELVPDGTAGTVVAPDAVEPLVTALTRLFDDAPLRRQQGDAARDVVVVSYGWQGTASAYQAMCGADIQAAV